MALGSTQPLTETSTRSISWGKGGRCVRLTTLPPSCDVMKSGNLNFLEPSGPLHACNGTALPLPFFYMRYHFQPKSEKTCEWNKQTLECGESVTAVNMGGGGEPTIQLLCALRKFWGCYLFVREHPKFTFVPQCGRSDVPSCWLVTKRTASNIR